MNKKAENVRASRPEFIVHVEHAFNEADHNQPAEDEGATAADGLWYKDAIIYQLHVKSFFDSNEDGIGDFAGLTEKLDYLQDLGVTALWLLPFYPSPGRDDGYDISDYGNINPDFGTMKDFRRLIQEAKKRGLRVIIELVINHTSDQHAWFKRARRSERGSSARDWYVWSDTDQKYADTRIIFSDTEKSNWTWDSEAGQFYWHRFFSHQPDLNFDNPNVVRALIQVMKRWLDTGVDGFRLDAITYLCEREGTSNQSLPETHAIIRKLRAELDDYAKDKVLLAEANQWPEDVQEFFGKSDECHMAYHFPLMPRIYMALAQEDRFPIADIMRQTPDIPSDCQWALFLRNHDELTLEMVTDAEKDYLWSTYANDPRARIYGGIRRRLAPLMDNDRRKIELMNSLLMSFPGTPIVYYGDEIGMGDNIYLGDRNGVRTPMQWTSDRNGGFSRADPARLWAPMIMDPVYGYEAVNVEAQSRSLGTLLSATKKLIATRKSTSAFGRGSITFIRPENRSVLAYVRQYREEVILCVANLSRSAQATELDLSAWKGRVPLEMLGRSRFPVIGEAPYMVTLAPYGFFWFELQPPHKSEPVRPHAVPEFETLVVPVGSTWVSLARERGVFERDVLPPHLARTRWYPEHTPRAIQPTLVSAVPFCDIGDNRPWIAFFQSQHHGQTSRYVLSLQIEWVRFDREHYNPQALAAVRQGAREGTLLDVTTDPIFIGLMLRNLAEGLTVDESEQGLKLEFRPTSKFDPSMAREPDRVRSFESDFPANSALVDHSFAFKLFRKLEPGIHPAIEMGRYLTDVVKFANAPDLLGAAELIEPDGSRSAIATLHAQVQNQGDAKVVMAGYLSRIVEQHRLLNDGEGEEQTPLRQMTHIGKRLAELHQALASEGGSPEFVPDPVRDQDWQRWRQEIVDSMDRALDALSLYRNSVAAADHPLVEQLASRKAALLDALERLAPIGLALAAIRHHGNFSLGQVLIVKDDVFIIGFEGEAGRSLEHRRRKMPAARDVAGLIHSIEASAEAALQRALEVAPDEQGRLALRLGDWRDRSAEAFLGGYREVMTDARLWPDDPWLAQRLIDFFLLEKGLYEIEYEAARRTQRLRFALIAVLRVLARQSSAFES